MPGGEFGKGLDREHVLIVIDRLHSVKHNTCIYHFLRIGQPKAEPSDGAAVRPLLAMSRTRLVDASLVSLSAAGRFTSAYNSLTRHTNYATGLNTKATGSGRIPDHRVA